MKLLLVCAIALERARLHAREMGHARGALYPQVAHDRGDECSAHYPSGSAQQYHINRRSRSPCASTSMQPATHAFLAEMGAEILIETARIWLQIGYFNARRDGGSGICAVTGPDEYTALVDNNHYTNRDGAGTSALRRGNDAHARSAVA